MSNDNNKLKLIVLDHGCYKELDEPTRLAYSRLWHSMIFLDMPNLYKSCEEFGIPKKYAKLLTFALTFSNLFTNKQDMNASIMDQRNVQTKMSQKEWKQLSNAIKEELGIPEGKHVDGISLMQDMLENVRKDFLLLSRTNVYIRSIMFLYERPINIFAIMAEYCMRGLHVPHGKPSIVNVTLTNGAQLQLPITNELALSLKEWAYTNWMWFRFKLQLISIQLLKWLFDWYRASNKQEEAIIDATKQVTGE